MKPPIVYGLKRPASDCWLTSVTVATTVAPSTGMPTARGITAGVQRDSDEQPNAHTAKLTLVEQHRVAGSHCRGRDAAEIGPASARCSALGADGQVVVGTEAQLCSRRLDPDHGGDGLGVVMSIEVHGLVGECAYSGWG